jgi:hypothetical protein
MSAISAKRAGWEIGAAHDHEGVAVARDINEVEEGRHHTAEGHHQHGEVLVHSAEQPVKGQHENNQDERTNQVGGWGATSSTAMRSPTNTG